MEVTALHFFDLVCFQDFFLNILKLFDGVDDLFVFVLFTKAVAIAVSTDHHFVVGGRTNRMLYT